MQPFQNTLNRMFDNIYIIQTVTKKERKRSSTNLYKRVLQILMYTRIMSIKENFSTVYHENQLSKCSFYSNFNTDFRFLKSIIKIVILDRLCRFNIISLMVSVSWVNIAGSPSLSRMQTSSDKENPKHRK